MNNCAKTIENVAMNYFYYYKADFSYFFANFENIASKPFF